MNNQSKPRTAAGKKLAKQIKAKKSLSAGQTGLNRNVTVRDSKVINAPVAKTTVTRTALPQQQRLPNGDVVVTHREFIQDVNGSQAYSVMGLPVNPGQSQTFPWLSTLSSLYESYKFESLGFEFKTMSSTAATGTVMMAIDYDASDPAPATKSQLASYEGNVRSSPWENVSQHSTSSNLGKRSSYYVRNGNLAANQDIKLYDVGNLFVATQAQADASPVGELYVTYRIRLMTPQLGNLAVGLSKSATINSSTTAIAFVTGSNVPIVQPVGRLNQGAVTFTATAPFDALFAVNGSLSTGTPAVTIATTGGAAVSAINTIVNGTAWQSAFEVQMLPGQSFTFDIGADRANQTGFAVFRIAQFNAAAL